MNERTKTSSSTDPIDPLSMLFEARSIAIVGASQAMETINGKPIKYLLESRFDGDIYPVTPKYDEIGGLKCYPSVRDIPGTVDLAVLAVSAARVPQILEDCVAKGIPAAVVFSSGFAELGDEGRAQQTRAMDIANQAGMRICGPNSMGTVNLRTGLIATFSTIAARTHRVGPLALISQSGMYASYILAQASELGLGFGLFATTGNEGDVNLAEVIEYAVHDAETSAVLAYVEEVRDGDAFVQAAEAGLEQDRPIVMIKVGRSDVGARTAQSHTGAIAGSHDAYEAVFRQHGIIAVDTIDEMLDIAQLIEYGVFPAGKRVGILSLSGGAAIMLADSSTAWGLEVPTLPDDVQAELKQQIPFAGVANPIDATGQLFNQPEAYGHFLQALIDQPDIDSLVFFFGHLFAYDDDLGSRVVADTVDAKQRSDKPFVMLATPGDGKPADMLRDGGIPCFADPDRAMRAVAAVANYVERRQVLLARKRNAGMIDRSPLPPSEVDTEFGAKYFLAEHGIRVTREAIATTSAEAVQHAESIGFPVVLKVNSPDIPHKTEVGGIRLDLSDGAAVEAAFDGIMDSVKGLSPDADIQGVSVQEMVPAGLELILGVKRDPVFGPMVLCGLGGIHAETMRDFSLRGAPVDRETAAEMLGDLRGYALLEGVRGREPVDIDAVVDAIVALSIIAVRAGDWIDELDINPLIALPRGQGCVVADALIRCHEYGA